MNNQPEKKPPFFKTFVRIIKLLFKYFPGLSAATLVSILLAAIAAAAPDFFMPQIYDYVTECVAKQGLWEDASSNIIAKILILVALYIIALIAVTLYTQFMAYITQGFLYKLRRDMFEKMQNLPIKFFDTHKHGEIMSRYTNDIDAIRELISSALPAILRAGAIVLFVFFVMIYYSVWMTLILLVGITAMLFVSKKAGGGSSKYFMKQQQLVAKSEGFVQEHMNGQKVVKIFNHEDECEEEYAKINEEFYQGSYKAHSYANILAPVIMNIGNITYVLAAIGGGLFIVLNTKYGFSNVSLSGREFSILSLIVPFLNMTKQFTSNVNQLSQQINAIVMGVAGASRVFELVDELPENDEGDVTIVRAYIHDDGQIEETTVRTGHWAWKIPEADGTYSYKELRGDIRLSNVNFGYKENKQILHDITLYAKPGQKVAFVGATGAGKTTITNLLNRFYDITDGTILYDGIDIKKIQKKELRRGIGVVLQDTNLFTGTVMENIRYGRLKATDDECIAAAKLAGADDFITRLPEGYSTMLTNNGSNLSQGQRQLLSIARAAVADPPAMILDEATSSIDTRTEAIVQEGMDKLMEGRTVFVIAHRLSTVKNSDVIMVLDHGVIIERGTHDDLIAQKGTYYSLYTGAFELE